MRDKRGKVIGVSLGPGDPELITVKGLNALQNADKIYFPGSLFKNGRKDSYSRSILDSYQLNPEKLVGFYLKMSLDRSEAESLYKETFDLIKQDVDTGLTVIVVSEGDASTYSSFSYLGKHFEKAQIELEIIPGVTSYALAAAKSTLPLGLQEEKMIILPRIQSREELQQCLALYDTVVLMKIRSSMEVIYATLDKSEFSIFYGERLGTNKEYISKDLNELKGREIPYFSLMIVKKENK